MQTRWIVLTVLIAASIASQSAFSQQKKEKEARKQEAAPASQAGGWRPCSGMFWTNDQPQCQLPDGRVCTVVQGSSGNATLTNCR
jgi:hypothetical protein